MQAAQPQPPADERNHCQARHAITSQPEAPDNDSFHNQLGQEPEEEEQEMLPAAKPQQRKNVAPRQTKLKPKPDPPARRKAPRQDNASCQEEEEDLPATYNNMPMKTKEPNITAQADEDEDEDDQASQCSHPADSQPDQQQEQDMDHDQLRKKDTSERHTGSALEYMADSESESDDYMPTQAKTAAAKAASKAAAMKPAAVKAEPKGRAKQPKQDKVS